MRLKQRVGDFHVRELLNEDFIQERGNYAVYRVTKKKMTTPEVVSFLSEEAGVQTGDINFCGLKDRQGVTTQFMSLPRKHRSVSVNEPGLRIEHAGFAEEPLDSMHSRGNAFEVTVRAVTPREVQILRTNIEAVREFGVVNYFDDQRFGNLRHDQGWVARELMLGNTENALRRMLFWPSPFDSARYERFKGDIGRHWGDWERCSGIARGFGEHFSIFDHLNENPGDFAGAFYRAPTRIRLIHLYAYQSHIWNRAAALLVRLATEKAERVVLPCDEGALLSFGNEVPTELLARGTLRLPGSHLEDTGADRELFEKVLAAEGLTAKDFHIEGVPGFALKGEDRPLIIVPGHLRVRPAEEDPLNHGTRLVRLRFELGRGSYATLVVKRLFEAVGEDRIDEQAKERSGQRPDGSGGERGSYQRSGDRGGFGQGASRQERGGFQRSGSGSDGFQARGPRGPRGPREERSGFQRDGDRGGRSDYQAGGGRPGQQGGGDRDRGSRPSYQGGGGSRPGYQGGGNRDGGSRPGYQGGGDRDGGRRPDAPRGEKKKGGNPWGSSKPADGGDSKSRDPQE